MTMKMIAAILISGVIGLCLLEFLTAGKETIISGRIVIPIIDLSVTDSSNHRILIETENEGIFEFRIPKSEVDKFLASAKSLESTDPPAIATIRFKKTLFGRKVNATVVDFKNGWIRTPK